MYPKAFLEFLESVGIDPSKDGAEDMLAGQADSADVRRGTSFQSSRFLPMVEMGPDFKVSVCRKSAPELGSLKGLPLVQLEFLAERVPWVLAEK